MGTNEIRGLDACWSIASNKFSALLGICDKSRTSGTRKDKPLSCAFSRSSFGSLLKMESLLAGKLNKRALSLALAGAKKKTNGQIWDQIQSGDDR